VFDAWGGAAGGRRGSIFPEWQHAGVEHATPAARCAVGTPGAELGEEWSTLGPRASLTGGGQMSNTVGGGSGGPCGWLRHLGRRMRKTARSCEATWQVEQWYYYHLELCIHWRWEQRPSASETASCRGWQQMRGAHLSGYPAHMRRINAKGITPCARTVPEDRCSQTHTNTGLLRLLGLCVTHLHRPRLSPARTPSLLRHPHLGRLSDDHSASPCVRAIEAHRSLSSSCP